MPLPALGGATGNDIWGWTDAKSKREFAIMGTSTSTGFVEVTDPKNPVLIGTLPTRGTPDYVLWRDIKVDGQYAYIVSEVSGSGLQVFDLRRLLTASTDTPTVFTSDAASDEFSYAHNISINQETDVAYVVGTTTGSRAAAPRSSAQSRTKSAASSSSSGSSGTSPGGSESSGGRSIPKSFSRC